LTGREEIPDEKACKSPDPGPYLSKWGKRPPTKKRGNENTFLKGVK